MEPRQTPTYEANIPEDLTGDGAMAAELAAMYFGEPMPWQPHLLDVMLARDSHDKFAAPEVGISTPRQNGKSWVVRARCLYGALNDEKILYTCHHGDTSDEMFQELSAIFEDEENDELHDLLKHVRKTNGKQAIVLKNGGLIRFTTRTDSGDRGKSFDVLILDEAQELTDSQQAALLPSISAGPKHNPQTIYLGTPPDTKCTGTVFRSLRTDIRKGDSLMAWIEWGATEVGDKHDRARWYEFNPSLGTVLTVKAVESECNQMQPEVFARERLGYWAPTAGAKLALNPDDWAKALREEPMEDGKLSFGVKFAPDGEKAAISWALTERNGGSYVELYDITDASTGPIADMLIRNADKIAAVFIDGKGKTETLVQRLKDGHFPAKAIMAGTPATMQAASAMFKDELEAGTLTHIESPALDASATGSVKRDIGGNGGWGFGDGDGCMSIPVESAAGALYAGRTTKREPRRQQEANF